MYQCVFPKRLAELTNQDPLLCADSFDRKYIWELGQEGWKRHLREKAILEARLKEEEAQ